MAADNDSVAAMLNFVPLTEAVNQIMTQLPRPLPPALYTQTKQILGNKFRRFLFRGTRRPSIAAIYGAPPRQVAQTPMNRQDVVMIHSIEQIVAGSEILDLMHRYDDYTVVLNAQQELQRRAFDFGQRTENMRSTCIHSAVANGKIWFSADWEILPSAVGAAHTVDYLVPNSNRLTSTVDWSDPAANITAYLSSILTYMMINGFGRRPKYAICGKNVQGYLAQNTSFREYLARNAAFNDYFVNNNQIASGVLGLEWIMAQDAYYEREDGSLAEIFPADQITLLPELTKDFYELAEGSQPVPKEFMTTVMKGDFTEVLKETLENPVYGQFSYSYGALLPVPQIWMVQGDNFYPDFKVPEAMWFVDTKP